LRSLLCLEEMQLAPPNLQDYKDIAS
jgi:hypothetical protein